MISHRQPEHLPTLETILSLAESENFKTLEAEAKKMMIATFIPSLLIQAERCKLKGNYKGAIEIYDDILSKFPNDIEALQNRMQLFKALDPEKYKTDSQLLTNLQERQKFIKEYARNHNMTIELAETIYEGKKAFERSEYLLTMMKLSKGLASLKVRDHDFELYRCLGLAAYHSKMYDIAMKYLLCVESDQSKFTARNFFELAQAYQAAGKLDEALISYTAAVDRDRFKHILTSEERSKVLKYLLSYEKPISEDKKADYQDKVALVKKGKEKLKQRKYKSAFDAFTQAIQLDNNDPNLFLERGLASVNLGNYTSEFMLERPDIASCATPLSAYLDYTIAIWLKVTEHHAENDQYHLSEYHRRKRTLCVKMGYMQGCTSEQVEIQSLLESDLLQNYGQQQEYVIELIAKGQEQLAAEKFDQAITFLLEAARLSSNAGAHIDLALTYTQMGQYSKALNVYEEAETKSNSPEQLKKIVNNKNRLIKHMDRLKKLKSGEVTKESKESKKQQAEQINSKDTHQTAKQKKKLKAKQKLTLVRKKESEQRTKEITKQKELNRIAKEKAAQKESERIAKEKVKELERIAKEEADKKESERLAKIEADKKVKEEAKIQAIEAPKPTQTACSMAASPGFPSKEVDVEPGLADTLQAQAFISELKQPSLDSTKQTFPKSEASLSLAPEIKKPEKEIKLKVVAHVEVNPIEYEILLRLQEEKEIAYLCGGTLRERLLNHPEDPSRDIDIVTTASEKTLLRVFADYGIKPDPFKPGLFKIFTPEGIKIEIYQSEHLKESLMHHAKHCDFTVNSCFCDVDGNVYDELNRGLKDLENNMLETVKPAEESFNEDPIRMLRAVKFAAQSNLTLSDDIKKAIANKGHLLLEMKNLSYVNSQIHKLLSKPGAGKKLELMIDHGLLDHLFPKMADNLKRDKQWILEKLNKIDQHHPSLDQIYMVFLVSLTMQDPSTDIKKLKNTINNNPLFSENFNNKYCNLNSLQTNLIKSWNLTHNIPTMVQPGLALHQPRGVQLPHSSVEQRAAMGLT